MGAVLLLGLTACDSPSELGSADAEGRMRLSAQKSYGEFGDYVVHINALNTSALTPDVAEKYGITRAGNNALVNLVVLKKSDEPGINAPVKARVTLKAANLTGQVKSVNVEEVIDSDSIYYISVLSIDDRETINFDFDIVPEGSNRKLPVRFTHEFYEG
jgi:hypothetical protein